MINISSLVKLGVKITVFLNFVIKIIEMRVNIMLVQVMVWCFPDTASFWSSESQFSLVDSIDN